MPQLPRSLAPAARTAGVLVLALLAIAGVRVTRDRPSHPAAPQVPPARPDTAAPSAAWLARLPDGEEKRRFVLDCTGCHLFDASIARPGGQPRTAAAWEAAVHRMLGFAGATTRFPVIAHDRDAARTAAWLARHLGDDATPAGSAPAGSTPVGEIATDPRATVTEFAVPATGDLPHDLAVLADGRVAVTGMMTHRMYVLDPATGAFDTVPLEVPGANPRAIEIAPDGAWWVVLGMPGQLARRDPATGAWRHYPVGMYAHSVAIDSAGGAWVNGHFTRSPELVARVDPASGRVDSVALPPHPTLADAPGGPVPYELRTAPDGRLWMSELQGNRMVALDPRTRAVETFTLPTSWSGPRRHDVGPDGIVWIPAYSANLLVRLDPRTRRFEEIPLPVPDAVPYVARVDHRTGRVWIGTAAGDVALAYDPATRRFTRYPLPSRGAMVRHLVVDARTNTVWLAYGASPGIAAKVARIAWP